MCGIRGSILTFFFCSVVMICNMCKNALEYARPDKDFKRLSHKQRNDDFNKQLMQPTFMNCAFLYKTYSVLSIHAMGAFLTTLAIPYLHLTSSVSRQASILTPYHVILNIAVPLATTVKLSFFR